MYPKVASILQNKTTMKNQKTNPSEYKFKQNETLISVTDKNGIIKYCNNSFINVSGFEKNELIGQHHNLVRHPEMPAEAFRDMWKTIKSGYPWVGLIKNKRKNGDYYWVEANVTPMLDGDEITGFMSVRTMPSQTKIETAEVFYRKMVNEAAIGRPRHFLKNGKIIKKGVFGKIYTLTSSYTSTKIIAAQIFALLIMVTGDFLDDSPATTAISFITALAFLIFFSRLSIINPLKCLAKDLNRLASGDLSAKIDTGAPGIIGKLQQAINQVSVNLRTVVHDVREEISHLDVAIQNIKSNNNHLSSRTDAQASSLEQTATSMEQINSTIQNSAISSRNGVSIAHETCNVARLSDESVQAVAKTMHDISASSKRIEDIIDLIEGVAFQTNILALNAAVEAARAGEQGRGFAVVANEVRSLAYRTSTAAKDIKNLIVDSGKRVAAGVATADEARIRMQSALDSVGMVSSVLNEISNTAEEQKIGVSQINEAIVHMDSITQKNATMVQEISASVEAVYLQVQTVSKSMCLFRLSPSDKTLSQMETSDCKSVISKPENKRIELQQNI